MVEILLSDQVMISISNVGSRHAFFTVFKLRISNPGRVRHKLLRIVKFGCVLFELQLRMLLRIIITFVLSNLSTLF